MTRARLAAALLFGAIWTRGATGRGADAPPALSTARRPLLFGAVHAVGRPGGWKNAPGPRSGRTAAVAETPDVFADTDFNSCRKLSDRKQLVKLTLKPDTNIDDLVVWISSITCREFVWSEAIAARNKKVTIMAPLTMTPRQAFGLFLDALDSIGLTVEPSGTFWRIIETRKVKSTPIPLYGFDGRRLVR
jgi:general secretion pathway protein D